MPANTQPIFGLTPNVGAVWISGTSVSARSDGVGTLGTDIFNVFTAGANGSYVQYLRFTQFDTDYTAAASTVKIYISTVGTGSTTAADTFLIGESEIPLNMTMGTALSANNYYNFPIEFSIPAGYYIHVAFASSDICYRLALVFGYDF